MRRVFLAVAVLAALAGRAGARPVRIAQAPGATAPVSADQALAAIGALEKRARDLAGQKQALDARYQQQLAAVDDLKRQRASWRRDRQLKSALADSLETAKQEAAAAAAIADVDAQLARARTVAIAAIDAELPGAADPRRAILQKARVQQKAALPAQAKKIVLPDDTLDPLADPEELDQQAAALREGESELEREADSLALQADRFAKQAELVRQHQRADELAMRDDAEPRRTPGGGTGAGDRTNNPTPTGSGPPGNGSGSGGTPTDGLSNTGGSSSSSFEGQPDFVLADVIDSTAIDALRRAGRGADPGAKAAAATAAHDQVLARLRRLRERRAAIEARARELRHQ